MRARKRNIVSTAAARALLAALAIAVLTAAAPAPVTLKTTEFGKGPTIVLVHTAGLGRMTWMPTARKLLSNYHVVMVDLPGHGESPMPDPFTFETAAEALDQVLAKQSAESTIVVGQGDGGRIAILAVHAHPDHARGVVAIDAPLKFPIKIDDQQRKHFLDYMDQNFDEFLKRIMTQQGRDSAQGIAIHAQATLVPKATMMTYMRMSLEEDASTAAKNFPRPILYIGSAKGWEANKDWATVAKELGWDEATGVQTLRIGASGALIASDQPDSLAMAISGFARQVLAAKK